MVVRLAHVIGKVFNGVEIIQFSIPDDFLFLGEDVPRDGIKYIFVENNGPGM